MTSPEGQDRRNSPTPTDSQIEKMNRRLDEAEARVEKLDGELRLLAEGLVMNREEIARLCSQLNGDPLEKTSDLLRYFASNPFYRDVIVGCYGVEPE